MGTSHFRNRIILSTSVYFIRLVSKILLVCTRAHHRFPQCMLLISSDTGNSSLAPFFSVNIILFFWTLGVDLEALKIYDLLIYFCHEEHKFEPCLCRFFLFSNDHIYLFLFLFFFRLTYFLKSKTTGLCTWNNTSNGLCLRRSLTDRALGTRDEWLAPSSDLFR